MDPVYRGLEAHPVCATCKGTGEVQQRGGTAVPCTACESRKGRQTPAESSGESA